MSHLRRAHGAQPAQAVHWRAANEVAVEREAKASGARTRCRRVVDARQDLDLASVKCDLKGKSVCACARYAEWIARAYRELHQRLRVVLRRAHSSRRVATLGQQLHDAAHICAMVMRA